jgi:enoyl-CoA hydratase/carnithine racemase
MPVTGQVQLRRDGATAFITLCNPPRLNAMSRAMWRELKAAALSLQADDSLRCVIVVGEGGAFCAGGDIAEYPGFRFEPAALADFHENDVWGALAALLACDLPLVAQIDGACMGAGIEIASCCDIRIAGEGARFGAPIARLGFPMAPREAQLVAGAVGELTAREMLLEAAVLGAAEMKARGFLTRVVPDGDVAREALATAGRIAALAPQAARMNKQALRALRGGADAARLAGRAYDYASSREHREGIQAFLDKRRPDF